MANRPREVIAMDDHGNVVGIFASVHAASEQLQIPAKTIYQSLRRGYHTAGFCWKYGEKQPPKKRKVGRRIVYPKVVVEAVLSVCGDYAEEVGRNIGRKVWRDFARWYIRQNDLFIESNVIVRIAGYTSEGDAISRTGANSPGVPPEKGNMTKRDNTSESHCPSS